MYGPELDTFVHEQWLVMFVWTYCAMYAGSVWLCHYHHPMPVLTLATEFAYMFQQIFIKQVTLTLGIINFKAESKFIVDWFHEINDKKNARKSYWYDIIYLIICTKHSYSTEYNYIIIE